MKHWKTKEEMGEGWGVSAEEWEKDEYNSLVDCRPDEEKITRTLFLVRDIWTTKQTLDLVDGALDMALDKISGGYTRMSNKTVKKKLEEIKKTIRNYPSKELKMNGTKDLIKIIKARKDKNYKYLFKKSLELNMICFNNLERHKEYKLVEAIADFNDCSDTTECDYLSKKGKK